MIYMINNLFNNTIDCIFDINSTHIVLIKRGYDPFKGYWALPGGRQKINEELDETVVREMREEVGIDMKIDKSKLPALVNVLGHETCLEQIRTYYSGNDPRGGNTTVYAIQINDNVENIEKSLKNGDDASDVKVCRIDRIPELAFNHFRFIEDYFVRLKKYKNPIPAVDAIVEYNGKYVYVERKGIPRGKALPGGFAKHGKTYEQSIIEEVKEETNLEIEVKGLLGVYSNPLRDPRRHITTTVYIAKGHGKLKFGDDAMSGGLFELNNIPQFVFDHNQILNDYLYPK